MSNSSSEGDFILNELGLNAEKSEKPKKSSNKKSKGKSKKSQSNRKPLSLDDIMKSMGIGDDNNTQSNNQPPAQNNLPEHFGGQDIFSISTPSYQYQQNYINSMPTSINLSSFENRIVDYLNRSLRTITNEFSIELTRLFSFEDETAEIVSKYVDSLKKTIRDEINFSGENKLSTISTCFDSFASGFRDSFYEIDKLKNTSISKKVFELRNATATVSSYIPTIPSHFAHLELTNELGELSSVRSQYKSFRQKQFQTRRNLFLTQLDLECKIKSQQIETESIQKKMNQLENERSKFDLFDDQLEEPYSMKLSQNINSLIYQLNRYQKFKREKKTNYHLQSIKDLRRELNYLRQLYSYQLKSLINKANDSFTQTQILPPKPQFNQSLTMPYNSQLVPSLPPKEPMPIQEPKVSEISRSDINHQSFLNSIQERLKKAQERNQNSLNITSQYLSSLKKHERKRKHKHLTQFLESDDSVF